MGAWRIPRTRHVKVLCIDDQAVFRNVMRQVIAATPGFTQVGEGASGEAAVASAAALRPDLMLMDVHMPGLNGFDAATILMQQRRGVVVVLTSAAPPKPLPGSRPVAARSTWSASASSVRAPCSICGMAPVHHPDRVTRPHRRGVIVSA